MFYIDIFFNKFNTEFNFKMKMESVEKNLEKFIDEIMNNYSYVINNNSTIDFENIYKEFYKFKIKFSDMFLIDKDYNENNQFVIHYDSTQQKDNIINFIKKNKKLNIILVLENYNNIVKALKNEEYPNLKIKFENSKNPISYKEFYNMYNKLNEIVVFIKHHNLSPLERVFLVYDIVKSNVYTKENSDESYTKSRDLNEIINSNKIVCVGYANLINYLLKNLGIKNDCIITYNKERNVGHQYNYLYLDDSKYNLKGVFFLDATADSKKTTNYIDNYNFFLKPFKFFNSEKIFIKSPKELKILSKSSEEIYKEIKNGNKEILSNMLKLLRFIDIKYSLLETLSKLFSDDNYLKSLIELIKEEYNPSKIDEHIFKNALYKVRRIEYANNIIKFTPDEHYIDIISNKYFKISPEENLFRAILGLESATLDESIKEVNATSVEEDLLRMRFLKALKTEINNLPENDIIKKM